ncbi:GtrA family protein [Rhodanobacter sp. MP7CTX1]|uniref:GtrA family protein n=1 Tax=Rhodanobacter sp. MP7CTX1 TaxID=2723084 RepID=UPI0017DC4B28|nr:GtrA family protein [Rhodanobacter sp. MP7CTX1]MBB6187488.1 putative flippase GtrA [Rhodanobacter sp. MP7CTX1]
MMLSHGKRQFVRFILAGGIAATVNIAARWLLNLWISYTAAIVVAFLIGIVTAFALNRIFVFRQSSNKLHHQLSWFVAINLIALAQTLIISLVLTKWLLPVINWQWEPELVAHAIGVGVPLITSYIGHKTFSFRQ